MPSDKDVFYRSFKVIIANEDRDTIVLYFFSLALVAQYVRFLPQSWNNEICMRIELYGCPMGKTTDCMSSYLN